jgi:hypothetical protein
MITAMTNISGNSKGAASNMQNRSSERFHSGSPFGGEEGIRDSWVSWSSDCFILVEAGQSESKALIRIAAKNCIHVRTIAKKPRQVPGGYFAQGSALAGEPLFPPTSTALHPSIPLIRSG